MLRQEALDQILALLRAEAEQDVYLRGKPVLKLLFTSCAAIDRASPLSYCSDCQMHLSTCKDSECLRAGKMQTGLHNTYEQHEKACTLLI